MRVADIYRQIAASCRTLMKGATEWAVECDSKADRRRRVRHPSDLIEDARRTHLRAAEYRAVADQMENPTSRASYRYMAETYEARARALERQARRLERGDEERETG